MPVRKYRSVAEMPALPRRQPSGAEGMRIACELSELAFSLRPWRFEPGILKFRSVEEADRARRVWEGLQVRR